MKTKPKTEPLLLRTPVVARMLGTDVQRVRHLIRIGELRAIRFNGTGYHRIHRDEVDRYAREGGPQS